jgi:hypothetical protein
MREGRAGAGGARAFLCAVCASRTGAEGGGAATAPVAGALAQVAFVGNPGTKELMGGGGLL